MDVLHSSFCVLKTNSVLNSHNCTECALMPPSLSPVTEYDLSLSHTGYNVQCLAGWCMACDIVFGFGFRPQGHIHVDIVRSNFRNCSCATL